MSGLTLIKSLVAASAVCLISRLIAGVFYRHRDARALRVTTSIREDAQFQRFTDAFGKAFDVILSPHREKIRLRTIEESIPDLISFLASAFRASLSLKQAISEAGKYFQEPLKGELERLDAELTAGFSYSDALDGFARRVPLSDIRFLGMVLKMHQRSGGGLLPALESLGGCVRSRVSLRKEVRVMTGQSRFSAMILCVLPLFFLVMMPALTGRTAFDLMRSATGCLLLVAGVALDAVAFFVMRKLTDIKIS